MNVLKQTKQKRLSKLYGSYRDFDYFVYQERRWYDSKWVWRLDNPHEDREAHHYFCWLENPSTIGKVKRQFFKQVDRHHFEQESFKNAPLFKPHPDYVSDLSGTSCSIDDIEHDDFKVIGCDFGMHHLITINQRTLERHTWHPEELDKFEDWAQTMYDDFDKCAAAWMPEYKEMFKRMNSKN